MKILNCNRFLIMCSVCIMLLFLVFNIYTPLVADDYIYSFGMHSVGDILVSQYHHYFFWGGRSVAHFLVQFWLLIGKPFFNIANH